MKEKKTKFHRVSHFKFMKALYMYKEIGEHVIKASE